MCLMSDMFAWSVQVLKTMVGSNLSDKQLQEIVDKTILYADKDKDGKISFEEFCDVSEMIVLWYGFFANRFPAWLNIFSLRATLFDEERVIVSMLLDRIRQ